MEWARQSCRAWGGRLARHRRHFHRLRVPEPGMRAASKGVVCRAHGDLTPGPSPQAERGERQSPSRRMNGGSFSSFQSAGIRHDDCLGNLPGERRPHPDPPTAGRPLSGPRRARHSGEGRTAAVPCCAGSAVRLSPPGTGGVAPRSGDGVGPSPFHRFRVPEPGMRAASKGVVCRANGDLTPGPSPRVERGERQRFTTARESPFASPLLYPPVAGPREGWPAAGGTG
jgi:hypothetical protein